MKQALAHLEMPIEDICFICQFLDLQNQNKITLEDFSQLYLETIKNIRSK